VLAPQPCLNNSYNKNNFTATKCKRCNLPVMVMFAVYIHQIKLVVKSITCLKEHIYVTYNYFMGN